MTRKTKQNKTKRYLCIVVAVIMSVLMCISIACKRPTQASSFDIYDPDDKSDKGDENGQIDSNNSIYDSKLIDYRTVKGADPVVVAFGDNKENLLLVFENDSELYYKASLNGGLKFTKEGILGKRISDSGGTASRLSSPVVFTRGNRIIVVASEKGTFGKEYNHPVQPSYNSRLMQIQGTMDPSTGEIAWDYIWQPFTTDSGIEIKTYLEGKVGRMYNQYATVSGVGKGTASRFVLPITFASIQQATGQFGVLMAYSSDGKKWVLGEAAIHTENDSTAVTKYLETKVFSITENEKKVELLARPRWNGSARKLGIIKFSDYASWHQGNSGERKEAPILDGQSVFETVINSENGINYTYIINGRGNNSDIKLAKYSGDSIELNGNSISEIVISATGRAGSVALLGDNTIATFVDNGGELIYRRFTQKYFSTQETAGSEVAE